MKTSPMYSDLNLDFIKTPSGDVALCYNVEAIKKSIRNLCKTAFLESPFNSKKGSEVGSMLFENFTPIMLDYMRTNLKRLLEENETRIEVISIDVREYLDQNAVTIKIFFKINQTKEEVSFEFLVSETK